jgi:hypothetical protein
MVPRHNVYLIIALTISALIAPISAYAATSGLDTPTGVSDLPFSVQGAQMMDLNGTGLGIGTASPLGPLTVKQTSATQVRIVG